MQPTVDSKTLGNNKNLKSFINDNHVFGTFKGMLQGWFEKFSESPAEVTVSTNQF